MSELGMGTEKSSVRRPLLLRTMLDILAEADAPVPAGEVVQLVADRVVLNATEQSMSTSGAQRAETFVRFASSWASKIGWISKRGGWSITEAGLDARSEYSPDELYRELSSRYRAQRRRRLASHPTDRWARLRDVLELIEPGSWTSYGDLAEVVGSSASAVGHYLTSQGVSGQRYRVLQANGTIAPGFEWSDLRAADGLRLTLENEGVEFDGSGHANPAQRVDADDLRAMLEDIEPESAQRGWLVRGSSVNGRDLVPTWLSKGSVSLAATRLRDVEAGMTKDELKPIVETDYAHTSYSSRAEKLDEFHFFLSRMQIGDLVATTDQGRLYVGRITGEATYQASDDGRSNLRRQAAWSHRGVDYADLPPELAARLQSQRDVLDLTQQLDALEQLLEAGPQGTEERAAAPLQLADATAELADELLVPQTWLQSCIDLLNDRPQLIFYGPPGTGKTYLARRLAAFLADDNVKLVQFHPAYSYEDFFEGYRPTPHGTFELRPGPLRRLVDQAQDDPSTPYILIIDEINRGNLAKIFGELYFLLEYRDQTIDLLYAAGDDTPGFTLPKNVYLIGTMNTADRSIALVDAAMRRRFSFVALRPDEEPTSGLLRRWLQRHHQDEFAADLLDEVNARIDDRDFQVGPSYLMRPAVYADGGLERVWRSDILPLLEEHHYGDGVDVSQRYGLAAVSAAAARDSRAERPEGE